MTAPIPVDRLDAILAEHVAILARTGAGKTYAAKTFAEHVLRANRRLCVIDPTGVWYGLRLDTDGIRPAFPVVIIGGDHADVPLEHTMGEQLGEIIGTRNLPCVIDISAFSTGERHRFVRDFLASLHTHNRAVLHLILDEADEAAPQNPMPETRRVLHEVDRVVRRGRVRGFRVIMISQRPAVLNKNVLTQVGTLIAMRMSGPQDRAAVETWIKDQATPAEAREMLSSLPGLTRGEGWVWAPGQHYLAQVRFPAITTYDSSRSPEDGDTLAEPQSLGEIDLGDLRALLAPADTETGEKAAPIVDWAAIRAEWKKAWRDGFAAGQTRLREAVLAVLNSDDAPPVPEPIGPSFFENAIEAVQADPPATARLSEPSRQPVGRAKRQQLNGELHAAGARMLEVLQRMAPDPFSWPEIATMAGLISGNGYFYAGRKALVERGLAAESDDGVRVGMTAMLDASPARITRPEVIGVWRAKLKAPAPEMVDFIARHGATTTEKMAEAIGKKPRNGYWYAGVAAARNAGLIRQAGGVFEMSPLLKRLET